MNIYTQKQNSTEDRWFDELGIHEKDVDIHDPEVSSIFFYEKTFRLYFMGYIVWINVCPFNKFTKCFGNHKIEAMIVCVSELDTKTTCCKKQCSCEHISISKVILFLH